MLLGQLYYFDKKLSTISEALSLGQFQDIELLGVQIDPSQFEGQETSSAARTYRDAFSAGYVSVLRQNQLTFAEMFWSYLTSPVIPTSTVFQPRSEFQSELVQWLQSGASLHNVSHLVKMGQLTSEEEDFALYYGLRALSVLTVASSQATMLSAQTSSQESAELSSTPQILVLTDTATAPLFVNINCTFVHISDSVEHNVQHTLDALNTSPEVKLVLIVSQSQSVQETLTQLQKKTDPSVFVTTLSFGNDASSGYFDDLVRKTLGVKLV